MNQEESLDDVREGFENWLNNNKDLLPETDKIIIDSIERDRLYVAYLAGIEFASKMYLDVLTKKVKEIK